MDLRKSIKYQWRFFFPVVGLLWIVIICMTFYQQSRETEYRKARLNDDLRMVNSRIIDAYENNVEMAPFMNFIQRYYENSELNGIRVSVYDDKGNLLWLIGDQIFRDRNGQVSPEFATALIQGHGTAVRPSYLDEDQATYYFYGVRMSTDGRISVHTAMPFTTTLYHSVDADDSIWLIVIIFALVISGIAYLFALYLGKNMKTLHLFAEKAASGDVLDMSELNFPNDELGEISRKIAELYTLRVEANERSEREHSLAIKATEDKIQMNREMSSNINHELKTPVGIIKGYLETILQNPDMSDDQRVMFLQKASANMDRLCSLLNDLSAITRLERGANEIIREKVDLTDLMVSISSELESSGATPNVKFWFDLPVGIEVVGNYNLLYGMFMNLIRNANLHSYGTECYLRLESESPEFYTFIFGDNGAGVAEPHLEHLFERFYRVDKGRTRKVGGTGLGLPIVKSTVEAMGGTIEVRNDPAHGHTGLQFVFTLPKP
ncbi:MAG: HAMP domain-containing histidine kinase [Muribaculum sp.]|nr:HAMP domain-containing histidine kinase [Muribaculum sp.]